MNVTLAAYQDILYCSRPVSRHPKMSIENRAKLFTPFSALRGFDIEILTQEQDRLLVPQISLASDREEEIYRVLNGLHQGDWATVTYFVPVKHIAQQLLGEYTVVSGEVKRVDDVEQLLVLEGYPILIPILQVPPGTCWLSAKSAARGCPSRRRWMIPSADSTCLTGWTRALCRRHGWRAAKRFSLSYAIDAFGSPPQSRIVL